MVTKSNVSIASTIDAELVDLGHGIYDAYTNMAIDEVLLNFANSTGRFFFRSYDFSKDSIILANSDSPSNLKESGDVIDVTRRIAAGSLYT